MNQEWATFWIYEWAPFYYVTYTLNWIDYNSQEVELEILWEFKKVEIIELQLGNVVR